MEQLIEACRTVCLNFDELKAEEQFQIAARFDSDLRPEQFFWHDNVEQHRFEVESYHWGEYVKHYWNYK